MTLPVQFPDPLVVRWHATTEDGNRVFRLEHYFRFKSKVATVTAPTGMLTDGASVPRVFWSIFQPYGRYFPAAVIHDWLYLAASAKTGIDRKDADEIFLEAMAALGVPWISRRTIHAAVRAGGWRWFRKL
jgi:hypothetical protein